MVQPMPPETTVIGVFTSRKAAQDAILELKSLGLRDDQIGMIGRHEGPGSSFTTTHAAEGAAIGAASGAGVGALWALGIAAGALPAIGPVVAGGLLASVLASAAGGAAAAGLIGALIGLGIPEDEAKFYESEVKSGRTLVTARTPDKALHVKDILKKYGGYDVHDEQDERMPPKPVRPTPPPAEHRTGAGHWPESPSAPSHEKPIGETTFPFPRN